MTAFIVQAREEAVRRNQAKKLPHGHLSVFALGAVWGREQPATEDDVQTVSQMMADLYADSHPGAPIYPGPEVFDRDARAVLAALSAARAVGRDAR